MIDADDIIAFVKLLGPEGIFQNFSEKNQPVKGFLYSVIVIVVVLALCFLLKSP